MVKFFFLGTRAAMCSPKILVVEKRGSWGAETSAWWVHGTLSG
jgi:hypothetical protein